MQDLIKLEDMMYSIRCQTCPEGFPLIVGPENTLDDLTIQKCQKCSEKPCQEFLIEYLDVKKQVEEILGKSDIALGEPEHCVR